MSPNLTRYGLVEEANFFKESSAYNAKKASATSKDDIDVTIKNLEDFYMTNTIAKASPTMAKCVAAVRQHKERNAYVES